MSFKGLCAVLFHIGGRYHYEINISCYGNETPTILSEIDCENVGGGALSTALKIIRKMSEIDCENVGGGALQAIGDGIARVSEIDCENVGGGAHIFILKKRREMSEIDCENVGGGAHRFQPEPRGLLVRNRL